MKHITYFKRDGRWLWQRRYKGKKYQKMFRYKTDVLCYKFIKELKFKTFNML